MPAQYYHGLLAQPDCWNCPLQHDRKVLPDGPVPARIVFVGEAPGRQESIEGKGFVGPSGYMLWKLAERAGLTRADVWVSNAALCRLRAVRLQTGAVLDMKTVQTTATICCRRRLLQELSIVTHGIQHPVVVPLGNWALWALSGIPNPKITSYRGSRLDIDLQVMLSHANCSTGYPTK